MKPAGLCLLLLVMAILYHGTHGAIAQDFIRGRVNDRNLEQLFNMMYSRSEPFGLLPTMYFLSTYLAQYTEAQVACQSLGGHLAEINSPSEMDFVTDFFRSRSRVQPGDEIMISGYRINNQGNFVSSTDVDMYHVQQAFDDGIIIYNDNPGSIDLYTQFLPNRPRDVRNGDPTCLCIQRAGDNLAMTNIRCSAPNPSTTPGQRYLCEAAL